MSAVSAKVRNIRAEGPAADLRRLARLDPGYADRQDRARGLATRVSAPLRHAVAADAPTAVQLRVQL